MLLTAFATTQPVRCATHVWMDICVLQVRLYADATRSIICMHASALKYCWRWLAHCKDALAVFAVFAVFATMARQ